MNRVKFLHRPILVAVLCLAIMAAFFAGQASAYQGHMWSALALLQRANAQLQAAIPDKAGNRVQAINLVNQAIEEVREGIAAGAQ